MLRSCVSLSRQAFGAVLPQVTRRQLSATSSTATAAAMLPIRSTALPPARITVPVISFNREQVGSIELDSRVFVAPVRTDIIHRHGQYVHR
jgi:hypothetical protein